MQIEISPWRGKFHGYLLSYENGSESITGSKTEESIFITDLALNGSKYQNGKIHLDQNSESYCDLCLELIGKNKLEASYNCGGHITKETWYRKGQVMPKKSVKTSRSTKNKTDSEVTEKTKEGIGPSKPSKSSNTNDEIPKKETSQRSIPKIEGETKRQSSFYIVGIQDIVKYGDDKNMGKAIEALWVKANSNDFSTQLSNIVDADKMYVSYSSYDEPKGKVSITLGYNVENMSNIPSGLKGVKIPANDFLVYPLSGNKSDFEVEAWEQLGELIMYRKANSADFEVYTFDNNYNVKQATMWIATK